MSDCGKLHHYADDVIFVRTHLNTPLLSRNPGWLRVWALVNSLQWLPTAWSATLNQPQVINSESKGVPKQAAVTPLENFGLVMYNTEGNRGPQTEPNDEEKKQL